MPDSESSAPVDRPVRGPAIYAATLPCENCGKSTAHRILRLTPIAPGPTHSVAGTARCRTCGWTHRFQVTSPPVVEVSEVISRGPTSEHRRVLLPAATRVELGAPVPGSEEPVTVQKIETRTGRTVSSARPEEVSTLWVRQDSGAVVPVSVVDGATTSSERLVLPPTSRLTVGEPIAVRVGSVRIVSLRARGRTWRLPGDSFVAKDVQRVYARRTDSPPAGSRPWRTVRATPSSRARATSTSPRSRSGPGVRRARRSPRARSAAGGADVHSRSPR